MSGRLRVFMDSFYSLSDVNLGASLLFLIISLFSVHLVSCSSFWHTPTTCCMFILLFCCRYFPSNHALITLLLGRGLWETVSLTCKGRIKLCVWICCCSWCDFNLGLIIFTRIHSHYPLEITKWNMYWMYTFYVSITFLFLLKNCHFDWLWLSSKFTNYYLILRLYHYLLLPLFQLSYYLLFYCSLLFITVFPSSLL